MKNKPVRWNFVDEITKNDVFKIVFCMDLVYPLLIIYGLGRRRLATTL